MTGNKIIPFPEREPPDNQDRIIFHLCDGWALGFDRLQWMVMRARKRRGQREWTPVSFIMSTKDILRRCISENGIQPTPGAQAKLDALPDTFKEWIAEHDRREVA